MSVIVPYYYILIFVIRTDINDDLNWEGLHMDSVMKKQVAALASTIRDVFKIPMPITNIDNVVKSLGGEIREDNNLIFDDSDGYISRNGDSFIIYVSPYQSSNRRNFTIAHEIGHLFLHMGFIVAPDVWKAQGEAAFYRNGSSESEKQAHEFAAALLMPEEEYVKQLKKYTQGNTVTTSKIAEYFNVSVEAASIRGKWLGLLEW